MRRFLAVLFVCLTSLMQSPSAFADTQTVTTDGDTFVESSSAQRGVAHGVSANLRVQLGTSFAGEQRTYLEFPSPNIPVGSTGISAVLRLNLHEIVGPKAVRTHVTGDFAESALTWDNQPALQAVFSSTTVAGPNGPKTLPVPVNPQARNQYVLSTTTNTGGTVSNLAFSSKEHATNPDPQLVVTYTPPGTGSVDSDGDGIPDSSDACPNVPAPGTSDGCPVTPPPPGTCNLNATPSNFAAQVTAASSGQTVCLASGSYGQWTGTNKAITVKEQAGASATMTISFGSGDSGFTLDGMGGMSGSVGSGASNITVKNSAFTSCLNFSGALTNVVFDANTHNNINATCGNSRIGIGASSGLTIKNSQMAGGDSDGAFVFGSGFVFENNHVAPCETGATGNHTDGLQYADPGAPANGWSGVVRKNFFDANACANDYVQALTSYDGGTDGALWEDNAVNTTRNFGVELYADEFSTVRHNTVDYCSSGGCVFGGDGGRIVITNKSADPASTGTIVTDNVGFVSGVPGNGQNLRNVSPAAAILVGGSDPTTWAGHALADSSPVGQSTAPGGFDTGIRVGTSPPP